MFCWFYIFLLSFCDLIFCFDLKLYGVQQSKSKILFYVFWLSLIVLKKILKPKKVSKTKLALYSVLNVCLATLCFIKTDSPVSKTFQVVLFIKSLVWNSSICERDLMPILLTFSKILMSEIPHNPYKGLFFICQSERITLEHNITCKKKH